MLRWHVLDRFERGWVTGCWRRHNITKSLTGPDTHLAYGGNKSRWPEELSR